MKRTLKTGIVLALCFVLLVLAGFAAYRGYRQYGWNNYITQEKLDVIRNSLAVLPYNADNYPIDIDHYGFDYSWLSAGEPVLIAHALGGIDGHTYTNSLEAMELAYENGLKIFEADMQIVDGDILLLHDIAGTLEMCGFESNDFSSKDFLNSSIYGEYTPMTWQDLMGFMAEHPDVYVVTDTKYNHQPFMSYIISAIAAEAVNYDESLLDRVIVQVYSQRMLDDIMDIYPFKSVIYTLYMSPDDDERVRAFCAQSGVKVVTMPQARCTEEFVTSLDAIGVCTLTHTINDAQQAALLIDSGVTGIYTDFLTPADITG